MKNESTISEHLLVAYWKGEATEAEKQEVETWLTVNQENRGLFDQWKQAWEHAGAMADFDAIDVEVRWSAVNRQINQEKAGKQVGFFPMVWRYAAAVVLLAAAGFLILRGGGDLAMIERVADNGPIAVTLADGTKVWLNENATLRYPESFDGDRRVVELTGEAFFEVAHNPAKPFSVMADSTETRVLGTSFNIKEQEGNRLELVLVTGKVRFSRSDDWEILSPGEKLVVDESGSISKADNGQPNFMSWRTRKLEFDSTAMSIVVQDVEQLYGVNIDIASDVISNCPLTTTFQNDSLEDVLETFKILFDAEVRKTDSGYRLMGGSCPIQSP